MLTTRPKNYTVVEAKWVFRNKLDVVNTIVRNKARLVARVLQLRDGIDYDKPFVLVIRLKVTRLLLAFASFMIIKLYQIDVKCAFLNEHLQQEVYIELPPDLEDLKKLDQAHKLHKYLCGFKQALKAWYD